MGKTKKIQKLEQLGEENKQLKAQLRFPIFLFSNGSQ